MALVRLRWLATVEYQADVEVDDWEGEGAADEDGTLDSTLADLEVVDGDKHCVGVSDREVTSSKVLRAGNKPVELGDVTAPQHEPEWDDDDLYHGPQSAESRGLGDVSRETSP